MKMIFGYLFLFVIVHQAYYVRGECCDPSTLLFDRTDPTKSCADFNATQYIARFRFHPSRTTNHCVIHSACGDGKRKAEERHGCGVGECNWFGCNCDGGCIRGNPGESLKKLHGDSIKLVH